MIKSMTGFGRCEVSRDDRKVLVEIKSVNHRYLELGIKIPRKLNYLDGALRNLAKEFVERGKVDIFVSYENLGEGDECIRYNPSLAKEYYEAYSQISQELGTENDIKTSHIMRSPDVITIESAQDDEEAVKSIVMDATKSALEMLVESRTVEGERLKKDILDKLDSIKKGVAFVEEKSPVIVNEYREKINEKVHELLEDNQVDESRIAQEVTMFADKVSVDEEIVRLKSHVEQMIGTFDEDGAIGRRLDFITQEMNREANTTLSKTTDKDISERAITLKTDIEKVREQIQNIE